MKYFIDEIMKNREIRDEFLKEGLSLSNRNSASALLHLAHYGNNPLLKKFVEATVIRPGLARLENALADPLHCDFPEHYLLGNIIVGFWASNPSKIIRQPLTDSGLSGHILNVGAPGSGKTVWNCHFIDQIVLQYNSCNVRVLAFTSKALCEQRNIVWNNRNSKGSIVFLPKNNLFINCFNSIKNCDDNLMISELSRAIATHIQLQTGGQLFLQNMIKQYLSSNPDGNLFDFTYWLSLQRVSGFDLKGYRDRLVNRLTAIMDELGNIFNCYKGIKDEKFIKNNVIIEIPCSNTFIMALLTSIILMRIFRYKSSNPESLAYKNIIVLEDIQGGLRRYE